METETQISQSTLRLSEQTLKVWFKTLSKLEKSGQISLLSRSWNVMTEQEQAEAVSLAKQLGRLARENFGLTSQKTPAQDYFEWIKAWVPSKNAAERKYWQTHADSDWRVVAFASTYRLED